MSALEKVFVNRRAKGDWNVRRLRERLAGANLADVRDVLELGCGRGDVAAFLARERDVRVHGVDVDPAQVELARRTHPEGDRLRFSVGDAAGLPFGAASFDLVVAQHVLHHVPDWERVPGEIARVLRPGGHLLWLDLAVPGPLRPLARSLASRAGVYTYREVAAAFRAAGLEERSHRRVWMGPLVHHDVLLQRR